MGSKIVVITGVVILAATSAWWVLGLGEETQPTQVYQQPATPKVPLKDLIWRLEKTTDQSFPTQATLQTLARNMVPDLPQNARILNIAIKDELIFLADYPNYCVWKYDTTSKALTKFGEGFIIPSAYFDLVAGPTRLWVVNPGKHRIQAYRYDGRPDPSRDWGKLGGALADFDGCCNPTFLAMLSDGRFVTAQKGGRMSVKVYTQKGDLDSVVAPTADFATGQRIVGLRVNDRAIEVDVQQGKKQFTRTYVPNEGAGDVDCR